MNPIEEEISIKICMVGDSSVGKTCIVNRYVNETYDGNEKSTVGVNFISTLALIKGKMQKVTLWDTAGEERFRAMIDLYFRNALGAFCVYDVTQRETFEHLPDWIERVRNVEPAIKIHILGNKCDLQPILIHQEEIDNLCNKFNVNHTFVSACNGTNIKSVFQELLNKVEIPVENDVNYVGLNSIDEKSSGCC